MSIRQKIANAISPSSGYAKALKTGRMGTGEVPRISFKKQIDASFKDVAAQDFVEILAKQVTGMGFYTTCATEDKYFDAEKAKAIVDGFNEDNDVDDLLQDTGREIVATGNSVWQLLQEGVMHVPIVSFDRIFTNEFLRLEETDFTRKKRIKLGLQQTSEYGGQLISPENLWLFRVNKIDGSGWGSGIMRVLMEEYTWTEWDNSQQKDVVRTRPSLLQIKAKLDVDLIEIFEKFAGPIEAWVTSNDKLAKAVEIELKKTPKYGGRLVASGGKDSTLDIKTPPMDVRGRFEGIVDYLWNQFCLGGLTPLPKLFTTPGFTEASATAAISIADRLILPTQRLLKRRMEQLWRKVIVKADSKLDSAAAAVRLNWGSPEAPEVKISDLVALAQISASSGLQFIRPEELRKNLVKNGVELWDVQNQVAPKPSQEAAT